jgi:hypothetical protein
MLIMAGGLNKIVARFGDVLGTNLYGYYGSFVVCVIAIAVVYALILPALLLVPKQLIDRRRPNARNRLNQPITLNAAAAGGKGGCGPGLEVLATAVTVAPALVRFFVALRPDFPILPVR